MRRRRTCAGASKPCARSCRPKREPPVVAKLDINAQPDPLSRPGSALADRTAVARAGGQHLRPRLERVPGVATVQVLGGEQREIHVDVDALSWLPIGLTIEDVVNALKASGRDIPGGGVTQGSRETDVRLSAASHPWTPSATRRYWRSIGNRDAGRRLAVIRHHPQLPASLR